MPKQRISYVPPEKMDAAMLAEMERCAREGTPRPESSAVRAHVPACFWFFANSWRDVFRNGILDHSIKELCRVYVSRSVVCEYCGNQRSVKGAAEGLKEGQYDELLNFEKTATYSEREKAALVELGCAIGLTLGQQSWLRLLNIDHHQVMAGTDASMAPGFEDATALQKAKASPEYWARTRSTPR
jgi:hypothetical protein